MSIPVQYLPAAYSLTAMGIWGASDFLGGIGARKANAFLFTAVVHLSGVLLMGSAALLTHAPFPGRTAVLWCIAAGSSPLSAATSTRFNPAMCAATASASGRRQHVECIPPGDTPQAATGRAGTRCQGAAWRRT